MQQRTAGKVRELPEITIKTDTRDILSHATMQAEGSGGLLYRRHRRPRRRDAVLVRDHRSHRQRCHSANGPGHDVKGRQQLDGAAQCPARHFVPERLRSHSAPSRARRDRGRKRNPSLHGAGAPLHGCDGPRLPGGVSDADAGAWDAPAGRHRGRRRPGLQSLAHRAHSAARRARQGAPVPSLQYASGLPRYRPGLRSTPRE